MTAHPAPDPCMEVPVSVQMMFIGFMRKIRNSEKSTVPGMDKPVCAISECFKGRQCDALQML